MVFGNLQGLPKLMGFLEGEDQESTQTGAELKGLGHEKHLHGRKPRIHIWRYGFEGVEMTDNQDWGMVEEPVYSLFIEICHLPPDGGIQLPDLIFYRKRLIPFPRSLYGAFNPFGLIDEGLDGHCSDRFNPIR